MIKQRFIGDSIEGVKLYRYIMTLRRNGVWQRPKIMEIAWKKL